MSSQSHSDSPSAAGQPQGRPGSRGVRVAAAMGAVLLQIVVLYVTVAMGLFWGVWTYFVAVGQALAAFVAIVLLSRRRPVAALLVPLTSAALTAAILCVTSLIWPELLSP